MTPMAARWADLMAGVAAVEPNCPCPAAAVNISLIPILDAVRAVCRTRGGLDEADA